MFQGTPRDLVAAGEAAGLGRDTGEPVDSAAERGYSAIMHRYREQHPGWHGQQDDMGRDIETWEVR